MSDSDPCDCDPWGDLSMDEDFDDPPEDRCGICRYSSEILSKKPDYFLCVYTSKHVRPNCRACREYLPPRGSQIKVFV